MDPWAGDLNARDEHLMYFLLAYDLHVCVYEQCSLAQLMEKGVPYVMPVRSSLHVHAYSRAKKLLDLLSCGSLQLY